MNRDFLLVDGVLRQDALQWLYGTGEPIEVIPLYNGTRWDGVKELGPILVGLDRHSFLLGEWQGNPHLQRQASKLQSSATLNDVADHLSQFITITDNLGSYSLFRFADPLVTAYWLNSYPSSAYQGLLGPISEWLVPLPPPNWAPSQAVEWQSYRPHPNSPRLEGKLNHLADDQVQALEQAYRRSFKERLYDWLIADYPQSLSGLGEQERGQWLEQRLLDAEAWGLVNERSIAIWLERCACWGNDFAMRPDSPYQAWLARTPDAQKLAPEQRIQALDEDCLAG
ncbi:DUF4123 domain-containing protein [Ectopseudomonas guguanensis]|jgi:hypothetical protein|uniref:DUF4123 domain-containing protein n=1 Tax=Ectopseudomonas guguanensis TaxID=1198456 RepID=UPI0012D5894F|nr:MULTISPECIES: DUF4123 domain-containing protein [Pseudomonas]MPT18536.1 DUF4123 domain-containing protein [Pseudomonas sp.]WJH59388.1 DUF4123 domain-containing protein [Pseudomonas guguanensis]